MATADLSLTVLPNDGHLDVFRHLLARDASQPAQLMNGQLMVSKLSLQRHPGGGTWWFFAHQTAARNNTHQWFEGTTPLQGQTSMVRL
jgi:hypothetical protein